MQEVAGYHVLVIVSMHGGTSCVVIRIDELEWNTRCAAYGLLRRSEFISPTFEMSDHNDREHNPGLLLLQRIWHSGVRT